MLIDVPVTIHIDHQGGLAAGGLSGNRPRHASTVTMRVDTENTDAPTQYCMGYPPKPGTRWFADPISIWDLVDGDTWRKLKSRAERWPYDYCADAEEGDRRQAEVDAEIEANGQFGVGA